MKLGADANRRQGRFAAAANRKTKIVPGWVITMCPAAAWGSNPFDAACAGLCFGGSIVLFLPAYRKSLFQSLSFSLSLSLTLRLCLFASVCVCLFVNVSAPASVPSVSDRMCMKRVTE